MSRALLVSVAACVALLSACAPSAPVSPTAPPTSAPATTEAPPTEAPPTTETLPVETPPAPTPVPAASCTIDAHERLLDQDPSDSQSPWRRVNGQRVVVSLETHAVTDPTYLADMAKGVAAWDHSPCVVPRLVDTCAAGDNCVHVVLRATGPAGDDGNFNDVTTGGYTVGGTIEYYTDRLAAEGPGAQRNVVTHEMGHALGLRHRLAKVLMNGDTYPDVFTPDDTDWHNLLVEYANQPS